MAFRTDRAAWPPRLTSVEPVTSDPLPGTAARALPGAAGGPRPAARATPRGVLGAEALGAAAAVAGAAWAGARRGARPLHVRAAAGARPMAGPLVPRTMWST